VENTVKCAECGLQLPATAKDGDVIVCPRCGIVGDVPAGAAPTEESVTASLPLPESGITVPDSPSTTGFSSPPLWVEPVFDLRPDHGVARSLVQTGLIVAALASIPSLLNQTLIAITLMQGMFDPEVVRAELDPKSTSLIATVSSVQVLVATVGAVILGRFLCCFCPWRGAGAARMSFVLTLSALFAAFGTHYLLSIVTPAMLKDFLLLLGGLIILVALLGLAAEFLHLIYLRNQAVALGSVNTARLAALTIRTLILLIVVSVAAGFGIAGLLWYRSFEEQQRALAQPVDVVVGTPPWSNARARAPVPFPADPLFLVCVLASILLSLVYGFWYLKLLWRSFRAINSRPAPIGDGTLPRRVIVQSVQRLNLSETDRDCP
jgi:hypothetical protein